MAWVALGLYLLYLALAFGWRSLLHWRRTGSTGFHGVSGRPNSPEWWGGALFALAVPLALLAPLLQAIGALGPIAALDGFSGHIAGFVLALGGIAATWGAQQAMGASWRIGVDPDESTALVTGGIFARIRNPIYTAMITTATGLTLLTPNVLALAAFAALVTAIQLQVRAVEEPYLLAAHHDEYRAYAARSGRFVPLVGRLDSAADAR